MNHLNFSSEKVTDRGDLGLFAYFDLGISDWSNVTTVSLIFDFK